MVKMVMEMKKNHSTYQVGFFEYHMIFFKQLIVFFFAFMLIKRNWKHYIKNPKN